MIAYIVFHYDIRTEFGRVPLDEEQETEDSRTMYELIQVSDNDYYIQSPAKIELVNLSDTEV